MNRALIFASAVLTGFGGLVFEIVCVRRSALLLGHGSLGLALVIGAFLMGLGLGGLVIPALQRVTRRPLRAAALLYAMVAIALPFGYQAIPLSVTACFLVPFLVATVMGGALPLLFPAVTRAGGGGAGLLQGANLLGSVVGASAGGVWLVPSFGMRTATLAASAAYLMATLLVAIARGFERSVAARAVVPENRAARSAKTYDLVLAAAGFCTVGLQIWMPRRLTFFLGGFLPTLSGTLVAVLVGLAAGSLLAELLPRGRRSIALTAALAAAGTGIAVMVVEMFGPDVATWRLDSTARAMWIASSLPIAAAFVATLALGALLPLVLREQAAEDGVAARTAGRSFFVFALGALAAAVLLPYSFLLPSALRVVPIVAAAPLLLVVLALWPRGGGIMTAAAAAAALVAGPLAFLNRPLLEGARNWPLHQVRKSVLAARADRVTSASVVADRLAGERLLYTDEFAAAGGVSSSYMRALGLLPVWFTEGRSEACALICLGTGTTAAALARSGARMHVVELSQAVVDLSIDWFGDNARAWRPATGARLHVTDGRQWLERQPPASLRAVTLEPLLPQAPGSVHLYSRGFYQAATRALVSGGVCVQWLPTHGLGPAAYRSLLRTFLDEFDQARAFLVDDSTLLVGAKGTSLGPPRIGGSEDGYLCGIWSSLDLELAELDVAAARARVKDAAIVTDDRPFLETAIHASGREVLGWLPTNLEVWRTAASDVLARARAHRLSAKIDASTAQQLKDPLALARALDALALARRAFPASLLLWREAHRIKAQRVRQQAMASLVAGAWPQALEGFEESVRLGRGTPLSLAGRVAALWRMGRRKAARTALRDLRRWWPQVLQVREITVHRELLAVLSSKGLAEVGAEAVAQIRIGADIGRAWSDGADWVRHSRLRWPYLSRWQLVQVLIGGLEINESRVSSLLAELDPATLDALRPWVDRAPAHRSLLERYVPKTVPRPGWWSK